MITVRKVKLIDIWHSLVSMYTSLAAAVTQWIRSCSWEFQPPCYNRRFGLISLQELLIIVVIYWTTPLRLTCFSYLSIRRKRSERTVRKWFRHHQEDSQGPTFIIWMPFKSWQKSCHKRVSHSSISCFLYIIRVPLIQ